MAHTPATHTWPVPQIAPPEQSGAAPQYERFVCGSTQLPPQAISPEGQGEVVQVPALQTSPAAQVAPPVQVAETPQCAGSFLGSMQAPAQVARFGAQVGAHIPAEQTWPSWQAVPIPHDDAPQYVRSRCGSTH